MAKASGLFDHIIVSTDDAEIAKVSKRWGAEVPFTRPQRSPTTMSGTTEVIAHATRWALDQSWPVRAVCCIYATAPFVQADDLKRGLEALELVTGQYAIAATDFVSPIFRSFQKKSRRRD